MNAKYTGTMLLGLDHSKQSKPKFIEDAIELNRNLNLTNVSRRLKSCEFTEEEAERLIKQIRGRIRK